ncbi:hypothetical protein LEM8419_01823 [Neolewinella maritima]|uniref:UspA domain-containing protein n=1 Tax=Neolewinella maritima TaxID=1383882 RepID=A0ABM9B224_9BACT|nr:universal stress protein [Neolewinella maritima]CAH1000689.1 hypothetical protein LEM8419_01823 [Neolewinella maritima]
MIYITRCGPAGQEIRPTNRTTMSKLIVPIDFSITSADALRFGCYLADLTGYDLEAIHVFDGYDGDPDFTVGRGSARVRGRVRDMLDRFVHVHAGTSAKSIKTREVVGSAIHQLVLQSQREDVAMIVMGGVGTGLSSSVTPVFGSVARSVALQAACPVLLIPQLAGVPDIRKAAIAFDETETLMELSTRFDVLREAFNPHVSVIHVLFQDTRREEHVELSLIKAMFHDTFPHRAVDFDFLPEGDLTERLTNYTKDHHIDLLVVGRQSRNLFTQLLVRSEVGHLLDVSGVPVLVIPLPSEKE